MNTTTTTTTMMLVDELLSASISSSDVDRALEHWWTHLLPDFADKPNWLCLGTQEIGPLARERWLSSPVAAWHTAFKGRNALLFYSVDYTTRVVYTLGMISFAPVNVATMMMVTQALITDRCYLLLEQNEIVNPDLMHTPALQYPTLQTVHQQMKTTLLDPLMLGNLKIFDSDSERLLLSHALSIMTSLTMVVHTGRSGTAAGPDLAHRLQLIVPTKLGQLQLAKMRLYIQLALLGFGCDPGSPVLELGLQCFHLLNEAVIARYCPSEKHVARAIADFSLPFEPSCSLGARNNVILRELSKDQALGSKTVLPCFLPLHMAESRQVAIRLYEPHRVVGNANARILLVPGPISRAPAVSMFGMVSGEGAAIMIRPPMTDLGSTPGLLLDPTLPCSFHCLLKLGIVSSNRTGLLQRLIWFVENNLLLPVPTDRLVVVHELVPSQDAVFFSVQELVFHDLDQLSRFRIQWAARFALELLLSSSAVESSLYLSPTFLPHVPAHLYGSLSTLGVPLSQLLTKSNHAGRRQRLDRKAVALSLSNKHGPASVTWFLRDDAQASPLLWPLFPSWVAESVVEDVRQAHLSLQTDKQYKRDPRVYLRKTAAPGIAALYSQLWLPFIVRLFADMTNAHGRYQQALAAAATPSSSSSSLSSSGSSLANRTPASVYAEAARLEATIAASHTQLEEFFRDLNAGVPVVLEPGGQSLRAGKLRELMFTIQGQYRMHWHNFTDMGRKVHGVGLLSLVKQVLPGHTDALAIQHMHRWITEHNLVLLTPQARCVTQSSLSSSSSSDSQGTDFSIRSSFSAPRSMDEARLELAQWLSRVGKLTQGCVGQRYLRETRGLRDAPIPLLEGNPCLRYSDRLFAAEGCRLPALVCLTVHEIAAQRIYLDPETLGKNKDLEAAKKHKGSPILASGYKDSVRVQFRTDRWPHTAFICEGVETALSVAYALPDATVHAALGIGNIKDFEPHPGTRCVVWCRENDELPTNPDALAAFDQRTRRIRRALAARFERLHEVYPPQPYNDFNDIHIEHPGEAGSRMIRTCFDPVLIKIF